MTLYETLGGGISTNIRFPLPFPSAGSGDEDNTEAAAVATSGSVQSPLPLEPNVDDLREATPTPRSEPDPSSLSSGEPEQHQEAVNNQQVEGGVRETESETPPTPQATKPEPSTCLLYTSPSPRDQRGSRMPSSA